MIDLTNNNNQITTFNHPEFGNCRGLIIDNEPFFVGKDVAGALGYSNSSNAVLNHVENDDKCTKMIKSHTQNGDVVTKTTLINESGLYSLIFASKLPQAKAFKNWVTSEVLPSIRKHGAYMNDDILEKALEEPDYLIKVLSRLKQEKQKRVKAESKIEIDRPKVVFAEAVTNNNQCILIGELSKLLAQNGHDIGQNRLFKWLRVHGYLMQNKNIPTQKAIDLKVMELREKTVNLPNGNTKITFTPMITGKGQIYFINKFKENA